VIRRSILGVLGPIMTMAALAACSSPSNTAPPPSVFPASSDPAIVLDVPGSVAAGASFNVAWSGIETSGDFLVIVPAGATTWTETPDSPYVNASAGNPAALVAPKTAGAYEVWLLKGNTDGPIIIKARAPITVT
jgi:hypothetical protein